jgi:hypothetical protein
MRYLQSEGGRSSVRDRLLEAGVEVFLPLQKSVMTVERQE